MWTAWLTRFGIILSFIAAFLIAPDLLGQRRLESWRAALARRAMYMLLKLKSGFKGLIPTGEPGEEYIRQEVWGFIRFAMLVLLASAVFMFGLSSLLSKRWLGWILMLAGYVGCLILAFADDADEGIGSLLLTALVMSIAGWFGAFFIPIFLFYLLIDRLVIGLTSHGRFRRALLPVGIGAFVLGTLLQLIATFL